MIRVKGIRGQGMKVKIMFEHKNAQHKALNSYFKEYQFKTKFFSDQRKEESMVNSETKISLKYTIKITFCVAMLLCLIRCPESD